MVLVSLRMFVGSSYSLQLSMISGVLYHESNSSCASNHGSSSSFDMEIVVVKVDSFVTSIIVAISVPSAVSKDMLHGLVLNKIASLVRCADNGSFTIGVG